MTEQPHTSQGYPLSIVELTRWNQARAISGDHLGCPRQRLPEALVAGTHETAGDPVWICDACGFMTPIADAEMVETLGSTHRFTHQALSADLEPTNRYVVMPTHPASNPGTGTLTLRTADAAAAIVAATLTTAILAALLAWLIPAPPAIELPLIVMMAGVVGWAVGERRRSHGGAVSVTSRMNIRAGHVIPGDWITKPAAPTESRTDRSRPIAAWPAAIRNTHHAARVLQCVRMGNTSTIRITTTAGEIRLSDTSYVGIVEPAQPDLNDFTYHSRG